MTNLHLYAAMIAAAVSGLGMWLKFRKTRPRVIVLGQQLADANAAEFVRLSSNPEPSPLNRSYDQEKGGFGLLYVQSNDLDEVIGHLLEEFKTGPPLTRSHFARRLSMDDLYTLIHFSKRSAVLALPEKDPARCTAGMAALAAIDINRVDPRDLHWAVAVVDAVATSIGADRTKLYASALGWASASTRNALASFHAENQKGASLDAWVTG